MASNSGDSFGKTLARFREKLSEKQIQEFSYTSLKDVEDAIKDIQERLGPEKKLRNFSRIRKFLEAMQQVEQLVQIFLNVHEIVAFIWVRPPASDRLSMAVSAHQDTTYHRVPLSSRLW
jgi:hypothetical protein